MTMYAATFPGRAKRGDLQSREFRFYAEGRDEGKARASECRKTNEISVRVELKSANYAPRDARVFPR